MFSPMNKKWIALAFLLLLIYWLVQKTGSAVSEIIQRVIIPIITTVLFMLGLISWFWWLFGMLWFLLFTPSILSYFWPVSKIQPSTTNG